LAFAHEVKKKIKKLKHEIELLCKENTQNICVANEQRYKNDSSMSSFENIFGIYLKIYKFLKIINYRSSILKIK
jgi:hypothetical protein